MYIFCAKWRSPSSVWPYTYSFLCLSQFPAQRLHWTLYCSSYWHPTFPTHLSCQNQNQPITARNKWRWRRRTRMRYLFWRFLWLTSRYKKQLMSPPSHDQLDTTWLGFHGDDFDPQNSAVFKVGDLCMSLLAPFVSCSDSYLGSWFSHKLEVRIGMPK